MWITKQHISMVYLPRSNRDVKKCDVREIEVAVINLNIF